MGEATHVVQEVSDATTRVAQRILHGGLLGELAGRVLRHRTRRYLALEAAGRKQRCEMQGRVDATRP